MRTGTITPESYTFDWRHRWFADRVARRLGIPITDIRRMDVGHRSIVVTTLRRARGGGIQLDNRGEIAESTRRYDRGWWAL